MSCSFPSYRFCCGIGQFTLDSPGQKEEQWLSFFVSSNSPDSCKLMIDIYFLFAGFHLLFSIYMVIGIPCTSPFPVIKNVQDRWLISSGRLRRINQHNRNVLPRTYRSRYIRCILLDRLDPSISRWWYLVQESKLSVRHRFD